MESRARRSGGSRSSEVKAAYFAALRARLFGLPAWHLLQELHELLAGLIAGRASS
jgi:hypothetical protein